MHCQQILMVSKDSQTNNENIEYLLPHSYCNTIKYSSAGNFAVAFVLKREHT